MYGLSDNIELILVFNGIDSSNPTQLGEPWLVGFTF